MTSFWHDIEEKKPEEPTLSVVRCKFLCRRPKTSVTASFYLDVNCHKNFFHPLLLVYFKEKIFVVFAALRSTSKWLDNHCNLAFPWGWHLGTKIFPGDENVWLGFTYRSFFLFSKHSSYAHFSHTACHINLLQSIGFKAMVKRKIIIFEGCGERQIKFWR